MTKRDYESTPVADELCLRDTIIGLAEDLEALRTGLISPQDAMARATLAKQMFNGVRLYLQASRFLAEAARPVGNKGIPNHAAEGETQQ